MKLRILSEITATLPFTEYDFRQKYRESFAVSELGRIHAQLPLKELADKIRSHCPRKLLGYWGLWQMGGGEVLFGAQRKRGKGLGAIIYLS